LINLDQHGIRLDMLGHCRIATSLPTYPFLQDRFHHLCQMLLL
jgi:hypothetical protein